MDRLIIAHSYLHEFDLSTQTHAPTSTKTKVPTIPNAFHPKARLSQQPFSARALSALRKAVDLVHIILNSLSFNLHSKFAKSDKQTTSTFCRENTGSVWNELNTKSTFCNQKVLHFIPCMVQKHTVH